MHQVLIPKELFTNESLFLVRTLFETIYEENTELKLFDFNGTIVECLVVKTNPSKGKNIPIDFLKNLNMVYCYFIKNGLMYRKYLDTGIVDRIGQLAELNGVMILTGANNE